MHQALVATLATLLYLALHIIVDLAINVSKPVKTRVLVGQNRADQHMSIAHLPAKGVIYQVLKLIQSLAQIL